MKGLQPGGVNFAGNLTGLQAGLVNYTDGSGSGVQIGLVNLMPQNVWFNGLPGELAPAMIVFNWRFQGSGAAPEMSCCLGISNRKIWIVECRRSLDHESLQQVQNECE
jgi:hypothetical protein